MRRLEIAILGTRGVPGNYGGFETFAEELGSRLVERGHRVTVYCRTGNASSRAHEYRGMRLVHLPAIRHKYAETLSHTLLSAIHAGFHRYDIVYVCNSANAPVCFIPWLRRQRPILNVDGLEWQRQKWGRLAKRYYRWAARLAARMPIEVVTDARVIRDYYARELGRETPWFAYGTDLYGRGYGAERVEGMGLHPDEYILYVSRMEPENNALLAVQAYREVKSDLPLVMVGDAPYAREYIQRVHAAADSRVRFLGFRFGDDYHALQANARVYIQATEVGGTHPALVEAMGHRNAVIANDVPEHREVLGEAGLYFPRGSRSGLAAVLTRILEDDDRISALRTLAEERVRSSYTWDVVTDQYERFFDRLVRQR